MVTKRGLLDFGAHGRQAYRHEGPAGMHKTKMVREYGTKGREGRNFLKAVDRYHNRDDWNKDLGGGTSFLQGPTGDSSDYVDPLMRMGDTEALDAWQQDQGSERTSELDRQRLFADPENELDRNEMDSEALDQWYQDQASEKKENDAYAMDAMADAYPQFEGDERAAKQKVFEDAVASDDDLGSAEEGSGMWDKVKGLFSSDDEDGGGTETKRKPLSETQKWGLNMLKDSLSGANDVRPPAIRAPSVIRGQVAFPGLLSKKEPVHPRYSPKGLIA